MNSTRFGLGRSARVAFVAVFASSLCVAAIAAYGQGAASMAPAKRSFSVSEGRILDANGKRFVFQGVNMAHDWYQGQSESSIAQIAAKGANSVRIVLSNGARWSKVSADEASALVEQAKAAGLVSILEVHDTTGYGDEGAACSLDAAADYWIGLKEALEGQEAYALVNIGNEPWGNSKTKDWTDATIAAIKKVRAAGILNALVVDAPNWGQDWSGTMKAAAPSIFAADPLRLTIFSVHMYEVYGDRGAVESYLKAFADRKLPLIVGEFADTHAGKPVAAADAMALSKTLANGYLGWSWCGNSGGDEALDMILYWDPEDPSPWGKLIFADLAGAKSCSVFGE